MCEKLEPWSNLISTNQLLTLYREGINRFGGSSSHPKDGCLEQSLGAAYSAEMYVVSQASREGLCFAGYLLFYLAVNHCFVDGNKRIAWLAAMRVLLSIGLTVEVSDDEAETLCLQVADGTIRDGAEVVRWLSNRLDSIT